MKRLFLFVVAVVALFHVTRVSAQHESTEINGEQALKKLIEGNKRYTDNQLIHPDQTIERRAEVTKGQHPFSVILGCSDSRVPPEVIFDQGIGNLFVIRVAGNSLNNAIVGSIEYAVEHLGAPLIMVLGHEKCGAVDATIKGGKAPGHIGSLIGPLKLSVEKAKEMKGDLLDNAVRTNVEMIVSQLKSDPAILSEAVKKGKVKIVGARYDLETGTVEIIVP